MYNKPMFPPSTRILIVDDMPTIRELVKSQLRAMNLRNVVEATDGREALEMMNSSFGVQNPIELVISDWNMPHMTGLELLRQVRSSLNFPTIPFILLTSESEKEMVTDAILAGVSQYIVKPFSAKSFEDKLKAVWAKQQRAS